ncbi:MAG TPA: universal stress protein [Pirellulaceae bacterium]|nr:universal stress protein [Pirellulaceae bacterium]
MALLSGRPVIVPWDFSDMAASALQMACGMVSDRSLIHVVHVAQIPMTTDPVFVWGAVTEATLQHDANQAFERHVAEHSELQGVRFVTLFGDPGTMLSDYAVEHGADLIVISSHGRTGMSRLLLGSVAERVVRLAKCPVLVLRDGTGPTTG